MTNRSSRARHALYFAPCDPRQGMGGGARLDLMLKALEFLSFDTKLLSYDGSGGPSISTVNLSANTRMLKISVPRRLPKVLKLTAVAALILYGLAFSRGRRVVLAHSPGIASGLIGLVVSKLTGGYLLVDHMDRRDPDTPVALYRLVLKSASAVFAISHQLEREALELGARRIVYLPIFLDLARFPTHNHEKSPMRSSLNLGQREFVIGYFGSFSRLEGLPVLLEAFSHIRKDIPSAKLLLVGGRNVEGADDVKLIIHSGGLENSVILLPPQPYDRVPSLMQAADVLVAPKIRAPENDAANPIKVYEYLASAIPCITTSVGEASELLRETHAAFVVEPQNSAALESAIRLMFNNPANAMEIASKGRGLVEQFHSLDKAVRVIGETLTLVENRDLSDRRDDHAA